MKELKVKSLNSYILALALISGGAFAKSKVCFDGEIHIFCQEESSESYSLNGSFIAKGTFREFSARRAFDSDWCQDALEKIVLITKSGRSCFEFEENQDEAELTLNAVKGEKGHWTYFQ